MPVLATHRTPPAKAFTSALAEANSSPLSSKSAISFLTSMEKLPGESISVIVLTWTSDRRL
jgi:hypothetical protein